MEVRKQKYFSTPLRGGVNYAREFAFVRPHCPTDTRPLWGDLNPKLGISKNVHVSFITTLPLAGGKNLTLFKKLQPLYNPAARPARHTLTVLNFCSI